MRTALALAVAAGLIAVLTGSGMAAQADFVMKRTTKDATAQAFPPAVFPHTLHRVQFKCYVCHDSIFKMKAGANVIAMDNIFSGKLCGACHNGATAFAANFGSCDRCHRQ